MGKIKIPERPKLLDVLNWEGGGSWSVSDKGLVQIGYCYRELWYKVLGINILLILQYIGGQRYG